jgi:hypothetical protein
VSIGTYSAIDRAFFEDIGAFDEGMQLWGGENIDLSIRVRSISKISLLSFQRIRTTAQLQSINTPEASSFIHCIVVFTLYNCFVQSVLRPAV